MAVGKPAVNPFRRVCFDHTSESSQGTTRGSGIPADERGPASHRQPTKPISQPTGSRPCTRRNVRVQTRLDYPIDQRFPSFPGEDQAETKRGKRLRHGGFIRGRFPRALCGSGSVVPLGLILSWHLQSRGWPPLAIDGHPVGVAIVFIAGVDYCI